MVIESVTVTSIHGNSLWEIVNQSILTPRGAGRFPMGVNEQGGEYVDGKKK